MRHVRRVSLLLLLALVPRLQAQSAGGMHTHQPGMSHGGPLPTQAGQAVFATVAEIVRLLEADPTTDWRTVDLDRLRAHLLDMDHVALRSRVTSTWVPGGEMWTVRGSGATIGAIQRMTADHGAMMAQDTLFTIARRQLPDGVRLTVVAKDSGNVALVQRIRGLGFMGFMASGDHHPMHHLMLARGHAP